MSLSTNHSFIIKLWSEASAGEGGQVIWRGHITHVPSGTRQYLKSLTEAITFISPYLGEAGLGSDRRHWWQGWFMKRQ